MANKQSNLDRLAQLSEESLDAVVAVVERALLYGDGWLQRQVDGQFRARDNLNVVIIAERADPTREP